MASESFRLAQLVCRRTGRVVRRDRPHAALPSKETVATIRGGRAKFGVQVGSAAGARQALDVGADFLICQGTEAGGHVQATTPLIEALPRVLDEA